MKLHHSFAGVLLLASAALAAPLSIGDPAPAFTGKMIQGEQVTSFDPSKTYLLEFWATWCGPCKMSIPHLNELHTKYKDKGLVIIGQDVREKDDSLVAPFVKSKGEGMSYAVALDDKSASPLGSMYTAYPAATGFAGIPQTFIIQDGIILWTGHPMELKEELLDQVLAHTYKPDMALKAKVAAFTESMAAQDKIMARAYTAMAAAADPSHDSELDAALPDVARTTSPGAAARLRIQAYLYYNRISDALSASEKAVAGKTLDPASAASVLVDSSSQDPAVLAAAESYLKTAEAAGSTNYSDSIHARLAMLQGKQAEAVAYQQKAIAALPPGFGTDSPFHKDLALYQAGKLPPKAELPRSKSADPAASFH